MWPVSGMVFSRTGMHLISGHLHFWTRVNVIPDRIRRTILPHSSHSLTAD
jgi:hypothetical protein